MNIGIFGTDEDTTAMCKRAQEMIGAHSIKISRTPEPYLAGIAAKCKLYDFDSIIVTDATTMTTLLRALPDFRHPLDKRGSEKHLSTNDYAGSFFTISGTRLGREKDLDVLITNPFAHFNTTATGVFIFKRHVSKITQPAKWFPQTAFTWEVWTPANGEELLHRFSKAKVLSIDIETFRGDELRRIECVGYCALFPDGSTHTVVVPFRAMGAHQFVKRLNASAPPKLFQNGMYDNLYFLRFGVPCNNWLFDTQHLFHSWYSELPKRLDFITAFAVRKVRYWKDDSAGGDFNKWEYNAKDCWATLMTWCSLCVEVPAWAWANYHQEFPLVFPCLHIEADGLRVNKERFTKAMAETEASLKQSADKLAAWISPNFNPRSPVQVKKLLKILGCGNVDSSDAKALTKASASSPFNALIITELVIYRKKAKLLSTYFVWDKFWNARLYYKSNPAGTDTGRLASTESSFWCGLQIQNIPGGPMVKSWIECDDDWDAFAECDYAQSEARCVGYLSGCHALIALVESEYDYHKYNATAFFGVEYNEVTKAIRDLSKRVNHGSNYNMGPQTLLDTMGPRAVQEARRLLKLPRAWSLIAVCQFLLNTYAKTYPEVKKDWYNDLTRTISITKKLVSPLGWTRYFFTDPKSSKPALNAAVAHGPQNLSVGVINIVFYNVWRSSVYGDLRGLVRLKAQIHDSLFFAYRGSDTPARVQAMMRHPIPVTDVKGVTRTMLIPPDVSSGGKFWSDLKA